MTTEGEGTKCSDDIRDYYEIHKDVIEDLDGYVKKHGLVRGLI